MIQILRNNCYIGKDDLIYDNSTKQIYKATIGGLMKDMCNTSAKGIKIQHDGSMYLLKNNMYTFTSRLAKESQKLVESGVVPTSGKYMSPGL